MNQTENKTIKYDVYHQSEYSYRWGRESHDLFFTNPELFEKVASIEVDFDNPLQMDLKDVKPGQERTMQLERVYKITQNDFYPMEMVEQCARIRGGMFSWSLLSPVHHFLYGIHLPGGVGGSNGENLAARRSSMVGDVITCPADEISWEIVGIGFKQI